jgi:hypothetical protein
VLSVPGFEALHAGSNAPPPRTRAPCGLFKVTVPPPPPPPSRSAGAFPANRFTSYMTSPTSVDISFARGEMVRAVGGRAG